MAAARVKILLNRHEIVEKHRPAQRASQPRIAITQHLQWLRTVNIEPSLHSLPSFPSLLGSFLSLWRLSRGALFVTKQTLSTNISPTRTQNISTGLLDSWPRVGSSFWDSPAQMETASWAWTVNFPQIPTLPVPQQQLLFSLLALFLPFSLPSSLPLVPGSPPTSNYTATSAPTLSTSLLQLPPTPPTPPFHLHPHQHTLTRAASIITQNRFLNTVNIEPSR